MQPLSAPDVLAVWERGRTRHAIDRALLLFAAACPDVPADRLADLPLGQRNEALLRLRQSTFGPEIAAYIDCPGCGERMALTLHTHVFLARAGEREAGADFETDGFRFRRPTSRDLSAVLSDPDHESAASHLLERCCVARPDGVSPAWRQSLFETIERGLETLDPGADIRLSLSCGVCTHAWTAPFDIAAVLWDEVDAHARALLAAVHTLARAYGWSEQDVLALDEPRRAAYLSMVMA